MAPESGSSSPPIIRSSVVFPAPLGPHNPTRSRSVICQVTRSSNTRSPNAFVSSDSWIMLIRKQLLYHEAGAPRACPTDRHTVRHSTQKPQNSQNKKRLFSAGSAGSALIVVARPSSEGRFGAGEWCDGLFAERLCGGGKYLLHAEGLGEVPRNTEIEGVDGARFAGEP